MKTSMLSSAIFVVAAMAAVTSAGKITVVDPRVNYGNMNIFMDMFLFNINRQLPDSIYVGDIGGPFNMNTCYFVGLQNGIKRFGDATLVRTANQAKFAAGLRLAEVGITCQWHYTAFRGDISAITSIVNMESGFLWVLAPGQHPWLTQFSVVDMDPVRVDMSGLVGVNWLVEDIANWVLAGAQGEIEYIIETSVAAVVQSILDTMIIP